MNASESVRSGASVRSATLKVLILEDELTDAELIERTLRDGGLVNIAKHVETRESFSAALDEFAPDIVLADFTLPNYDGLSAIKLTHEKYPELPLIIVTGVLGDHVAVELIKAGAADYVLKDRLARLPAAVEKAISDAALQRRAAQQRQELESFARVIAHDLSAPIASLQLFARAIEEELNSETFDKDQIVDHCGEVVSAGQRAGALIDSLYEYTRADAPVAFEPVAMRQVMEDTLSNLKHVIQSRGVRVTHGELPVVFGNAPQLGQLLQNLISNGIKYCEAIQPTISVGARPDSDNMWRFAVTDNGIGFSKKDYQRVFEPFMRLHNDTVQGTGLGLATCKKIVERHGGTIRCESTVGEGTTFFFTLRGARG